MGTLQRNLTPFLTDLLSFIHLACVQSGRIYRTLTWILGLIFWPNPFVCFPGLPQELLLRRGFSDRSDGNTVLRLSLGCCSLSRVTRKPHRQ